MCVHQIMFKEPTTTQFKNILMLTLSSMCCQFFVFGTYQEINVTSMLCLSLHTGVGHSTHDTPLRVWNPYSTFQFSNRQSNYLENKFQERKMLKNEIFQVMCAHKNARGTNLTTSSKQVKLKCVHKLLFEHTANIPIP